jgi:hypothetical protein
VPTNANEAMTKRDAALAQLPSADYPFLPDTARHARAITAGEEFTGGLEGVLRGLEPQSGLRRQR